MNKDSPVYFHEQKGGCFQTLPLETPEKVYAGDEHVRQIWMESYLLFVSVGDSRDVARIKADEALEDYMKRFGKDADI